MLDHGGVLLSHLIHLNDGGIDLLQADGLFFGRGGDLGDQIIDLGDLFNDPLQGLTGLTHQIDARSDLTRTFANQALDLLGGFGGALCQGPHFGGDNGKATARITGAGSLDPGIEGQEVGLEGDLVNDADDLSDLTRRGFNFAHGRDGLADDDARLFGARLGRIDGPFGLDRPFGRATHRRGDLAQSGGGLFQTGGLVFGAARQVV